LSFHTRSDVVLIKGMGMLFVLDGPVLVRAAVPGQKGA